LIVPHTHLPVATLSITTRFDGKDTSELSEEVYGGYANQRGEVFLFTGEGAYRVNFKSQTLQRRPPLNVGAKAKYDAAEAGADFEYASKNFRRLSHEQITEICGSHRFRLISIPARF
jgi:hypothetical protein